jgi:branched-chain amino acid transport system permease protein
VKATLAGWWGAAGDTGRAVAVRRGLVVAGVLFLALVPQMGFTKGNTFFWSQILISIIFATATNLLVGYAGLVTFGQAVFFGSGTYAVGMLVTRAGWENIVVNILLAMIITGFVALAVGALIVRATGLSFAILTLAFGQLFFSFVLRESVFGGEDGLSGIVRDGVGPWDLRPVPNFYYFVLLLTALSVALMWLIVSSPFGLMLKSIRDDADRAQFLGVPVRLFKLAVFVIAGMFSGLAGALEGYHTIFASAEVFGLERSVEPIVMSILGGVPYFFGPAVGAVAYEWLRYWLQARTMSWVLWIGIGLVVIIIALRDGVLGVADKLTRSSDDGRHHATPTGPPATAVSQEVVT